MKAARYKARGVPDKVLEIVDVPPPPLQPGQARVAVLASPINPSDLLMLQGVYAILPPLPAIGGSEGVGRVVEVAPADSGDSPLKAGQLVSLPLGTPAWQQQVVITAAAASPLPDDADPQQLAMLTVNPPTAWLMLEEFVDLAEGEWVVQNAANSGVGNYLIQIAKRRGIRTANVVRRAEVGDGLKAMGADVVLVDDGSSGLGDRIREATGGGARLAIDAVGGGATMRLAQGLADGGVVVNYGVLSGQPCQLSGGDLIFRGITLRGFWVAAWLQRASRERRTALYTQLAELLLDGTLHTEIENTYPIDQAVEAVAHAMRGGRSGKILITPNG